MSDRDPAHAAPAPTVYPVIEPFSDPALFDGVLWRRIFAYGIDVVVLLCIGVVFWLALGVLTVLTLGLLTPLLVLLGTAIPIAYHTLTIGGSASGTLGMRLFDLEVRVWNGGKPGYLQALLHTAVFYVSIGFTSGLILLWALFNNRRRCLHDILCGTLVLRRSGNA